MHYCINCGSALEPRAVEGRAVEGCPNDSFILWHDPKVSTAVVVEDGERVVLGRRAIEPGYGLWCLPGGFVNDDEDPAVAAVRECREEIGAAVELTGLIDVYHVPKDDAPSIVVIAYRGHLAGGEIPTAGAEMLEVGAFDLGAIPALAFPSHQSVLSDYVRFRGREAAEGPRSGAAAARSGRPPSRPRAATTRSRKR